MSKLGHTIYLAVIGVLIAVVVWLAVDVPTENAEHVGERQREIVSIAVLPVVALDSEQSTIELSSRFTVELMTSLAKTTKLKVASRGSTEAFVDSKRDISEIDTALGVSRFVEGAIRIDRNRIRATAQLVDAVSGVHLWSESYDRDVGDLDSIISEISESVGSAHH